MLSPVLEDQDEADCQCQCDGGDHRDGNVFALEADDCHWLDWTPFPAEGSGLRCILLAQIRHRPASPRRDTPAVSIRSASSCAPKRAPGGGVPSPGMPEYPVFTLEQLTGRTRDHLTDLSDPRCSLHREVAGPYLAMRAAAAADGIDLAAFSGFRDFDRQLAIWNGKFRGERPMQDRAGRALDPLALPPAERVTAILWWSALPGASRHHWGTDFDVMDPGVLPPGYRLQVIPAEYGPGGPFERLTAWLDAHMHAYGFYRPYLHGSGRCSARALAPVLCAARRAGAAGAVARRAARRAGRGRHRRQAGSAGFARSENFASYVVNVDAPPETAAAPGSPEASSLQAQPQTFLIAPSISVRVVVIESSTPVNTGG